ncbi:hypothetical protein PWG71_27560 [Nocardiopsis sp. N85]|uniref:hypothetical protein n=1 Tax=Nocardiopsis sp. N85 TaxID=3029400 RepID=UPI00237FB3C9|nr:hypothetical protein [Nocardiopsis sp. N85]MDE3725155.1 hypothetical protein [Nocardiopsis sp. N85]
MASQPTRVQLLIARHALLMRTRPEPRTRLLVSLLVSLFVLTAIYSVLLLIVFWPGRSLVDWFTTAGFLLIAWSLCAALWRAHRAGHRAERSHPLPHDTDPVRPAIAVRHVRKQGKPSGDPEIDRLGRAMAESLLAFDLTGLLGVVFGVVTVMFGTLLIRYVPWLSNLPPGEMLSYALPLLSLPALTGAAFLAALWRRRRIGAFVTAYDRGAA